MDRAEKQDRKRREGLNREASDDSGFGRLVEHDGDNFSFDGKMDENELLHGPLHSSRGDFSLGGSKTGEMFSNSKASMSFNNSITDEGEFGVFVYEPDSGLPHSSLSDNGGWAEKEDLQGNLHEPHPSNEPYASRGMQSNQMPEVEPVRPPSRHQQQVNEQGPYGGSFRQPSNHDSETSLHAQEYSRTPPSSFEGSFGRLPVSEVSAEDIRQRQIGQHQVGQQIQHQLNQFNGDPHLMQQQQQQHQHGNQLRQFESQLDPQTQPQLYQQDHTMNTQQQPTVFNSSNFQMNPQQQQGQQHLPHIIHNPQHQQGQQNVANMIQDHQNGNLSQGLRLSAHGAPFSQTSLSQQHGGLQGNVFQQANISQQALLANCGPFYQRQSQATASIPGRQGNVSIANPAQNSKQMFGTMNNIPQVGPPMQTDVAAAMSEAMEKLSDSMKRTAMSRSMVKQFSGKNIAGHGSARALLAKQNSMRMGVGSQRPVRGMAHQLSEKSLPGDNRPSIRRTNSKHHLQHPNRVFRHDSQRSLNQSGHSLSFQIDGRNLGAF